MVWTVDYKSEVAKELAAQLKSGKLTTSDIAALKRWVYLIETRGLSSVQNESWSDHPLEAEWTGFRAAAFSPAGHVIYAVENGKLTVWVVRITATHNYQR
jgi:mRNA-degrading endonuclease YafQ of YafQ-DinJ toxin-antitoxin module